MAKDVESEDYTPLEGELFIHSLQYEAAPGVPDVDRSWGPLIDDDQIWRVAQLLARGPVGDMPQESARSSADEGLHGSASVHPDADLFTEVLQMIGSSPVSRGDKAFRVIGWTDR